MIGNNVIEATDNEFKVNDKILKFVELARFDVFRHV